jgi:hypothetical protein
MEHQCGYGCIFRVGDRVVVKNATIRHYNGIPDGKIFKIVKIDWLPGNGGTCHLSPKNKKVHKLHCSHLISAEIYESPLMKAMNEKV